MKLLSASSDLGELKELVKRLLHIGIPCAVCRDALNSQWSVWIQQDNDFPLALKMFVERRTPRPVPAWAHLIDVPVPEAEESAGLAAGDDAAAASEGVSSPGVTVVQVMGPTRTGTTGETVLECDAQRRRTGRRVEGWRLPGPWPAD